MPKIKRRRRQVAIGSLDDVVTLVSRSLRRPSINGYDYTISHADVDVEEPLLTTPANFQNDAPILFQDDVPMLFSEAADVWAMIETARGVTMFDRMNVERVLSHRIYLYFDQRVIDAVDDIWVRFNGNLLDIIDAQDFEGRGEFLELSCSFKGSDSVKGNYV